MNSKVFYLAWLRFQIEVSPAEIVLLQGWRRCCMSQFLNFLYRSPRAMQTHRAYACIMPIRKISAHLSAHIPQILDIYCSALGYKCWAVPMARALVPCQLFMRSIVLSEIYVYAGLRRKHISSGHISLKIHRIFRNHLEEMLREARKNQAVN